MRYIPKGPEPDIIRDFKATQQSAGLPATYDAFGVKGNKSALNDVLRAQQRNICCYCQRRIDHFQGDKNTGAHNEHLYPQSKDPGDGSIDLDHNNIYACCIASEGLKKKSQHCGEAKGNKVIVGSISDPQCEDRFKYNLIGEILPNGSFDDWKAYLSNYSQLPRSHQQIVDEIKILNLNCNSLITERRNVIDTIASWVSVTQSKDVMKWAETSEQNDELPIFYSTIKYILRMIHPEI